MNQRVLKDVEELTEFRGVSFDDWLHLIMQVNPDLLPKLM